MTRKSARNVTVAQQIEALRNLAITLQVRIAVDATYSYLIEDRMRDAVDTLDSVLLHVEIEDRRRQT